MIQPFHIISVGPGGRGNITFRAGELINTSDLLIGSPRAIDTVSFLIQERNPQPEIIYITNNRKVIISKIKKRKPSRQTALLVTGDAGFYSLLHFISLHFGKEEYLVCPGISSIQVAASRGKWLWHNAFFYSIHGRDLKEEISDFHEAFNRGTTIFILTDQKRNPPWLIKELRKRGFPVNEMEITLFFNLDYEDEKIIQTDYQQLENIYKTEEGKLCIMVLKKITP